MEMIDWMFALLNSWFIRQPYSRRTFFSAKSETNFLNFMEEASRVIIFTLLLSIKPFKPSNSLWQEHDIVGAVKDYLANFVR